MAHHARTWLYAALIVLCLVFAFDIRTNQSEADAAGNAEVRFNPDARLYYGLAVNLLAGQPYRDDVRNQQTVPPIGHPLWLAFTRSVGWSADGQTRVALWLGVGLLGLAVAVYTRNLAAVLAAVCIYAAYLAGVVWLVGNVETTIVLAQSALVLSLALLYRRRFGAGVALVAGGTLAATLLVRPIYLYALHAVTALALVGLARQLWRERFLPAPGALRGSLVLALSAQLAIAGVGLYSQLEYGDRRLVTGTYSAYPLYLGNSPYLDPDAIYVERTRKSPELERIRERFEHWDQSWQAREAYFMGLTVDYWRADPVRALRGFAWRIQHFLGLHAKQASQRGIRAPWSLALSHWGPLVHPLALLALLGLLAARLIVLRGRAGPAPETWLSLGVVLAGLFAIYTATHSLFAYVGFRYVTGSIPLVAAGLSILAWEVYDALAREPSARIRSGSVADALPRQEQP